MMNDGIPFFFAIENPWKESATYVTEIAHIIDKQGKLVYIPEDLA